MSDRESPAYIAAVERRTRAKLNGKTIRDDPNVTACLSGDFALSQKERAKKRKEREALLSSTPDIGDLEDLF